jgi:UDP-GlcNAc3NAcA epimerase
MSEVITVIGARPQFVKAAVVSRAIKEAGLSETIVHTGQHYDDTMSGCFIRELGIENIVAQFACGTGTHAVQTAKMMTEIEAFLLALPSLPKLVLVYGDTNSTIAAALVASKLHVSIAHVEAGLRSFNRNMPEEVNRIVTDHLSTLLFCSSHHGVEQLKKEGISDRVFDVGDVMLDAFDCFSAIAIATPENARIFKSLGDYCLVTIHRPSNTDNDRNLKAILKQLESVDRQFLWPVHPRLGERIKRFSIPSNVYLCDPLPYLQMLVALRASSLVATDSGGLQKEAYWSKKQCITVRNETEWIETLHGNWNQLFDPTKDELSEKISKAPTTEWKTMYGEGNASKMIADSLHHWLRSN